VHLIIENYFTAVAVLISNSVYRNRGVPIAAFEFSSRSVSFMCQLLNQNFKDLISLHFSKKYITKCYFYVMHNY